MGSKLQEKLDKKEEDINKERLKNKSKLQEKLDKKEEEMDEERLKNKER